MEQRNTQLNGFGMADQAWQRIYGTTNYQGSYALNGWFYRGISDADKEFGAESAIVRPPLTPVFADSVWPCLAGGAGPAGPEPLRRRRCLRGCTPTIGRHGKLDPRRAPRNVPPGSPLPGSITIQFADGHAEPVRLDLLWTLDRHRGYVPPAKRPN